MITKKESWLQRMDWVLLVSMLAAIGIGVLGIYSATYQSEFLFIKDNFQRQIIWAGLGVLGVIIIWQISPRFLYAISYPVYGFTAMLLIAVLFTGVGKSGIQRFLILGGIQITPSEIAKIATVMALARFLSDHRMTDHRVKNLMIAIALTTVPMALIFKQPDLGTSLVFPAILISMLFWAGTPWFSLFVMVAPVISIIVSPMNIYFFLGWLVFMTMVFYFAKQPKWVSVIVYALNIFIGLLTPFLWNQLKEYQQNRILIFLNPEADPRGQGYQILQSQTAIGSGGIFGKGYLLGTQTQLRFLPEQHTDFIFSVFGEEFGFLGVSIILVILLTLILRGIRIGALCKNKYSGLVAFGCTTVIGLHVFINVGMTVGILPVTGLPLPFLSYGGTSLIMNMSAVGILLNIHANRMKY